jgi:hypothetical protein
MLETPETPETPETLETLETLKEPNVPSVLSVLSACGLLVRRPAPWDQPPGAEPEQERQ